MQLVLDFDSLNLGDFEDFEDYTGMALQDAVDGGSLPRTTKVITALVWILQRKVDPKFTLQDARRMRFTDIDIDVGNPTVGESDQVAPARKAKPKRRAAATSKTSPTSSKSSPA